MCADFVKLDLSRVSDVLCFLLRDGWIRYICLGGAIFVTLFALISLDLHH